MGVRGLMTYIATNNEKIFFNSFELKNQIVVFNGQTVAHWIFTCKSEMDLQFSGDNDVYYTTVRDYFENFLHCGITPVVIMNGPFTELHASKVTAGIQYNKDGKEPKNLSTMIFKTDIFLQVLRDLKIKHYCSDRDSHKEVARVARMYNCPVIGLDSDSFIYDVPFIPVMSTFIDFRGVKQRRSIPCYIFDRDRFLRMHGLELTTLPVVATAIGNNFTKWELSKCFYENAGLATNRGGRFNDDCDNTYVDIPAVTAIFQGLDTESAAADKFLSYFSSEETRRQAGEALKKSLAFYDTEFKDDVTDAIPVSDRIKRLLKTGEISLAIAGLIRRNDFYFPVGVFEDLNKPSTADLCWDLLVGIYTFLQRQNENKLKMTVYLRNGSEDGRKEMTVNDSLGIKPGEMTVAERQAAFYRVADLDSKDITVMEMFPRSWQLFIAALQFWSKKMRTDKDFRSYHFHAILLNVFVVNAMSKKGVLVSNESHGDTAFKSNMILEKLRTIDVRDAVELWPLYLTLRKRKRDKKRVIFKRERCDTHFERCLLVVMEYLNALSLVMGTTFKPIRYDKFLNGSIIYSSMELLKSSDSVIERTSDLLKPSTKIRNFYQFLCSILHLYIPPV